MVVDLHLEGSVKTTKKKLTWLADTPDVVDVRLVDFDYLLNKDKVEEEDNVEDLLTPVTKFVDAAVGEASLRQMKKGEVIQVERRGYYICDVPYLRASEPITLLFVPDGKVRRLEISPPTADASPARRTRGPAIRNRSHPTLRRLASAPLPLNASGFDTTARPSAEHVWCEALRRRGHWSRLQPPAVRPRHAAI